jgi:hypothetical protein
MLLSSNHDHANSHCARLSPSMLSRARGANACYVCCASPKSSHHRIAQQHSRSDNAVLAAALPRARFNSLFGQVLLQHLCLIVVAPA